MMQFFTNISPKTFIKISLSVFMLFCLTTTVSAQKKCDYDLNKAEIDKALAGYQYEKTFRVDGKGGRLQYMEYTIVMRAGSTYKFTIQSPEGNANGIVMKVYDRRTKKRVFSNYTSSGVGQEVTYTCEKTGIYDIQFSFKGSKSYCGICICGRK